MLRIVAFALVVAASTTAVAAEFQVKNCSFGTITINGYNENDTVRAWPSSSEWLGHRQTGTVRCATGSCQLQVSGGKYSEKVYGPYDSAQCVILGYNEYAVYPPNTPVECSAERC